MRWILIIVLAIAVEFFVRFLTKNMEDKKKRERLLALIWFGFGAILIVVWLIYRFL
jgi:heme/copper-type cytochrome/quinol oxidase subunit 2